MYNTAIRLITKITGIHLVNNRLSRDHSLHQVWTLWDHSFLSYAPHKQTLSSYHKTISYILQHIMYVSMLTLCLRSSSRVWSFFSIIFRAPPIFDGGPMILMTSLRSSDFGIATVTSHSSIICRISLPFWPINWPWKSNGTLISSTTGTSAYIIKYKPICTVTNIHCREARSTETNMRDTVQNLLKQCEWNGSARWQMQLDFFICEIRKFSI